MHFESFPYLKQLLGGYFHQDAYDLEGTDEAIMQNFRQSSWEYQRTGTRADIQRFLHQHGDRLLPAFEQAFTPDIIIGQTDDEAREWLRKIEKLLDEPT